MPIVHKNGDLFTSKAKYLCHQVNCMGKMGSCGCLFVSRGRYWSYEY